MNETAVMQYEHGSIQRADQLELSVEEIVAKVAKVREVAEKVMKDGVHFGTIPGTPKPTLYKSGGEILGLTFRLAPKYEWTPRDLGKGHLEYLVRCELYHINTGAFFGAGVGSCSTMESKYRFRPGPKESTGKPVPSGYWDKRTSDPKAAQNLLGGPGFGTAKVEGRWEIVRRGETVENSNPANEYNTVLKMACKRAFVSAILSATAASEVYTQDQEDRKANEEVDDEIHGTQAANSEPPSPDQEQTPPENGHKEGGALISDPQRKRFYAIAKKSGFEDGEIKSILEACGYAHTADILKKHYQKLCESFESGTPADKQVMTEFLSKWCREN